MVCKYVASQRYESSMPFYFYESVLLGDKGIFYEEKTWNNGEVNLLLGIFTYQLGNLGNSDL